MKQSIFFWGVLLVIGQISAAESGQARDVTLLRTNQPGRPGFMKLFKKEKPSPLQKEDIVFIKRNSSSSAASTHDFQEPIKLVEQMTEKFPFTDTTQRDSGLCSSSDDDSLDGASDGEGDLEREGLSSVILFPSAPLVYVLDLASEPKRTKGLQRSCATYGATLKEKVLLALRKQEADPFYFYPMKLAVRPNIRSADNTPFSWLVRGKQDAYFTAIAKRQTMCRELGGINE